MRRPPAPSTCKGCGEQVKWATTAKAKSRIALTVDNENGNVLMTHHRVAHTFLDYATARADQDADLDRWHPDIFIAHRAVCTAPQEEQDTPLPALTKAEKEQQEIPF